jgi:PKD repeat protein
MAVLSTTRPALAQTPTGVVRAYPEHREGIRCAFDSAQQAAFARQPGAEAAYHRFLQGVAQLPADVRARLAAAPDVTVPVVVHIIHTGGSSNITDAQVLDAVRVINEDYSKTNRDSADVVPFFRPRYANVGFKMKLARLDPNGNCTTGITRTYSTDGNIGDDRVKNLIKWDQSKYLNIWVCTNANGAGGYAYLPCTGGAADGIVIRNAQFGSIGTSGGGNMAVRSLTHEIGHYFGLPHTWGGTNSPGLASNCGTDDGIADTPNTIGLLYGCDLTFSPCTDPATSQPILANVQNYMDYAGCTRMFTLGQRAVMRASLQLGCRQQLTSAANLLATGTNDGFTGGPCAPVPAFQPSAAVICEGSTVSFADYSYNADLTAPGVTYAWQFPGGMPATSALRTPTVTYPTGGIYAVTLSITGPGGTGTTTRPALVRVAGGNAGLSGPVAESFENPAFPDNFAAPDLRNWSYAASSTSGAARWTRATASAGLAVSSGQACLYLRTSLVPVGTTASITSPNINLSSYPVGTTLSLQFDQAYALRPVSVSDVLSVQFSNDCGVSWQTQRNLFAADLNTRDTLRVYGYAPTSAADWQRRQVIIPAAYRAGRFQARLQLQCGGGNYLYLDNVVVGPAYVLATAGKQAKDASMQVFPNPFTAETVVEFSLPTPGPVVLRLTDLLGRTVLPPQTLMGRAGQQTQRLLPAGSQPPAAGCYLVELVTPGARLTRKVVIN